MNTTRRRQFQLRLNDREYDQLFGVAKREGMTPSEWIRRKIDEGEVPSLRAVERPLRTTEEPVIVPDNRPAARPVRETTRVARVEEVEETAPRRIPGKVLQELRATWQANREDTNLLARFIARYPEYGAAIRAAVEGWEGGAA